MIERLVNDSYKSIYFKELYSKVVRMFIHNLFNSKNEGLTKKEIQDCLRFADIFSCSAQEDKKNLSYRLIGLLYNKYFNDKVYIVYSNAILKKLCNFPALKDAINIELPIDREIEYILSKELYKTPIGKNYFLPNQYYIYNEMKNNNILTLAGPTSMGKTFVVKQFVLELISNNHNVNFCFIVPTRALIKQYTLELCNQLKELNVSSYKVVTSANVIEFVKEIVQNYIFVLTPERLNGLLFSENKIVLDYLIIDEAHKIFEEDVRGITYYNTIDICIDKYEGLKVFFVSPLIQNPEIFQKSYNKKHMRKYKTDESPVTQNLFYVDFLEMKATIIDDQLNSDIELDITNYAVESNELYYKVGKDDKNIIYVSSRDKAIEYTMDFIKYLDASGLHLLSIEDSKEINKVRELIKENIHHEYYLIKALEYGVAYHFGKLPTVVRECIEKLFEQGHIKYLFCTNTLLEGVNLPVKNIFIMANYIGNRKMTSLDFWNLAGRAGRLGYEYYGNIFCVNDYKRKYAWKDKELLLNKQSIYLTDKLEESIESNMEEIKGIINSEEIRENFSEKDKYNNYLANIIKIDKITKNNSTILNKAEKVNDKILNEELLEEDYIQTSIINSCKDIDYNIQKNICQQDLLMLNKHINYDNCLKILEFLYVQYRWDIKEKRLKAKESLEFISLIMNLWINETSLNDIINKVLREKNKRRSKIRISYDEYEVFKRDNIQHVNIVINDVIIMIEDIIRFDLEKYFNHYYNILRFKYDEKQIGPNWALYLEFGTRNIKNIMLQNSGFSRYASKRLLTKYYKYLVFEGDVFIGIRNKILKEEINNDSVLYNDIILSNCII